MEWRVRFVDFPLQFSRFEAEIMATIRDTLSRGDLVMRSQLANFEEHLAAFVGASRAIGVSNCTDGMTLVLRALGIGPGDEVITVAHTFVATLAAVVHNGATPVLIDVGVDHNMDVDHLSSALTPRTKAILPVHLNGRMCRMDVVMSFAERHGLAVVEDSAQALGASFDGMRGGAFGAAGCFSFYPAKLLGAFGDAGGVTTSDDALASSVLILRDHGRATKDDLDGWGFNARLDNLQAAVLDVKLRYLASWIERRRELADRYEKALGDVDEVRTPPAPDEDARWYDNYQNYVIEAERRDELKAELERKSIETLVSGRKPLHLQGSLQLSRVHLPRTEELSRTVISLPLTTELEEWQIDYVSETIREFYRA